MHMALLSGQAVILVTNTGVAAIPVLPGGYVRSSTTSIGSNSPFLLRLVLYLFYSQSLPVVSF